MVWPGVESDEPSGDGWKGCWTLVLMILERRRGREADISRSRREKVCGVGEDEAVSGDSGQRLRLRGEGERWCGRGSGGGEKKISLVALFGGNDPANKA